MESDTILRGSSVKRPHKRRLGPIRKGGFSEDRPAARVAPGPAAPPVAGPHPPAPGAAPRFPGVLLAILLAAAGGLAGCASVAVPEGDAGVVPADLDYTSSIRGLGRDLGLAVKEEASLRSIVLSGSAGRILFMDGTRMVTVAGRRLETVAPLQFAGGDALLHRDDAARITGAWREVLARERARPEPVARAAPPPAASAVPADPEWQVPLKRRWEGILIHHSATDSGNLEQFDRFHREKNGWLMVGYNFIICNGSGGADGLVQTSDRWRQQIQGAHAGTGLRQYNEHWIGICLVGDFNRSRPTARQMASLRRLVAYLQDRCGIPDANVRGHRDVRDTDCPGKRFPLDDALGGSPPAR